MFMQSPDPVLPSPTLPPVATRSLPGGLIVGAIMVAALYFGRDLLVPLVLAALLAFVLAPLTSILERAKLPRVAAVLLAVALAFLAIGVIGMIVFRQAATLAKEVPDYATTITAKWHHIVDSRLVHRVLGDISKGNGDATQAAVPAGSQGVLSLAQRFAQPILGPLLTAGVVLVFTLFILLSAEDLRDRFVRLVGRRDLHRTIFALNDAGRRLSRYFLFQLLLNAAFGVLIASGLRLIGLPGAVLWGILAAMMRFVPFVGTFIALALPLVLAIAVSPGWETAIAVMVLFAGIELTTSQIVEPLIYGHSTGLSPIAVIVATGFWALIWGPVGLLLATPLTVCLVVLGRHVEKLAFLDVVFGDTPPLMPGETFYQRALEGKSQVLLANAKAHIANNTLVDYCDRVALPGLALAQSDHARDALTFERLEAVHGRIATLLAELSVAHAPRHAGGSIVCIPARGQLDDLAAMMAVEVMRDAGFDARLEQNQVLGKSGVSTSPLDETRICCLSVLEEGSNVSGIQYLVRRIERTMPGTVVVVGLWQAQGSSPMLAQLRSVGRDEHLVLSIGELLAFTKAIVERPGFQNGLRDTVGQSALALPTNGNRD